jgi:hypothetical protein
VLLYVFTVTFVLQLFVGIPLFVVWWWLTRGEMPSPESAAPTGEVLVFLYVGLAPAILVTTLFFLKILDRRPPREVGLAWPGGGQAFGQALLSLLVVGGCLTLWALVVGRLPGVTPGGWVLRLAEEGGSFRALGLAGLLLAGFLVQGAAEELVYRGYVYRNLKDRWSWAHAAAVTSLLFAFVHGLNPHVTPVAIVNTFVIGILLALSVEFTGSLWMASLLHGLWNFTIAVLLGLPLSGIGMFHVAELGLEGPASLTGGDYGPEGSAALTALLLPAMFVLSWLVERRMAGAAREEEGVG